MNGLALARNYYAAYKQQLLAQHDRCADRIAAGLVGFGSECFGYDDEHSQDHDFGPGFCIWLSDEDYASVGEALQASYERLPKEFAGFPARQTNARSGKRVGVFSISEFYSQFLGAPQLPISDADWLQIPEELLASAVNGEVFEDTPGVFSAIRARLQAYYPESIKRRKLANAVAKMAQTGQYNLPRSLQRREMATALICHAEFIRNTCLLVHILNGKYAPFYKWLHRGIRDLPILSSGLHEKIDRLSQAPLASAQPIIETICAEALNVLIAEGYAKPGDAFLEAHVDEIMGRDHKGKRS